MPSLVLRKFDGGLWIAGPPESGPEGSMRRNRGMAWQPNSGAIVSRFGCNNGGPLATLGGLPAHSATVFLGNPVVGEGTQLFGPWGSFAGITGAPFFFLAAASVADVDEPAYLFVRTADQFFKVNPGTFAKTQWGIDPPATPPTGSLAAQVNLPLDPLDDEGTWTPTHATLGHSNAITISANPSITMDVDVNRVGEMAKTGLTLNLVPTFYGFPSPDEDWVRFGVRIEHPRHIDKISIVFGNDANFNSSYSFDITIDDDVKHQRQRGQKRKGTGSLAGISNDQMTFKVDAGESSFPLGTSELLGELKASPADNTWAIMLIPKAAFAPNGPAPDWTTITAIKFAVRTNTKGAATVYLNDLSLVGGVGMQGDYQYHVTFKNSVTGHRSNSDPAALTPDTTLKVKNVARQPVDLANIPVSADPQVDTRELWRTLGNGSVFFHLTDISDNTTTVFTDMYADYPGLHGTSTLILGDEELPIDNDPPHSFPDLQVLLAGQPVLHLNRVWWPAANGKVYYSPPGRAESIAGFLLVSRVVDERVIAVIEWDDQLYVFARSGVYVVLGTDEPFLLRRVPGVPPVAPFVTYTSNVVAGTPMGIIYPATDGFRMVRGQASQLLDYPALTRETGFAESLPTPPDDVELTPIELENVTAITSTEHEVLIAMTPNPSPATSFVYRLADGTWTDTGLKLLYATTLDLFRTYLAGTQAVGGLTLIDYPGVFTDAADHPLLFDVEPVHTMVTADRQAGLVRYVQFRIDTSAQVITPTLELDGDVFVLPPMVTTGLTNVEYPVNRWATVIGHRLAGSLTTGRVTLTEIDYDIYLPETHSAVAPSVEVPTPKDAPTETTAEGA